MGDILHLRLGGCPAGWVVAEAGPWGVSVVSVPPDVNEEILDSDASVQDSLACESEGPVDRGVCQPPPHVSEPFFIFFYFFQEELFTKETPRTKD